MGITIVSLLRASPSIPPAQTQTQTPSAETPRQIPTIALIHSNRPRRPPRFYCRQQARALDDPIHDLDERPPDVGARLGAGLAEARAEGLGQRPALLGRDLPAASLLRLVQLGSDLAIVNSSEVLMGLDLGVGCETEIMMLGGRGYV